MKFKVWILVSLLIVGCGVIDPSAFRYLDDPNVELKPLLIFGAEQDIEISLPRALATRLPESLLMKPEGLELSYTRILRFPYEWQWGGPTHKDKGLYIIELAFAYDRGRKLFSETVEHKIQMTKKIYEDMENDNWREYVLKKMIVERYQSSQGYEWVMDNHPTVMRYHENFRLAISDERQFVVWFWYNEDWVKTHPEWYERRKALSRRILDSVKLTGDHSINIIDEINPEH